jgi:hypothetical protein
MDKTRFLIQIFSLALMFAVAANLQGQLSPCTQQNIDGTTPPTTNYIYPRVPYRTLLSMGEQQRILRRSGPDTGWPQQRAVDVAIRRPARLLLRFGPGGNVLQE